MSAICVVGAGPRGTAVLERLCAWADEQPLEIHVVDPYPPGPGRIWRRDQSALLWMNSTVAGVRMFTGPDDGGLGRSGVVPTFEEWLTAVAPHELSGELASLARRMTGTSFAPRPLVGEYFSWVFERVVATAPDSVRVRVHRTRAVDLADAPDGGQLVRLADGSRLAVDQVVLAQGNFEARTTDEERSLARFAERHGLRYVPSGYFDESRLRSVPAGEPVLLRGFGLTSIDCIALLCEGRGGRFTPAADGGLRYVPSGREPVLFVGSRRGLPYRAKFGYRIDPPPLPRFFTAESARALGLPLEFERDLLPLLMKEVAAAYYHELFRTRPERVRRGWREFSAALSDVDWNSREWRALVADGVPEESDRFSWDLLDRHLDDPGGLDLQRAIRRHIAADLRHRGDPEFSPEQAAVHGLLSAVGVLIELVEADALSARSLVVELERGFLPLLSYITSGPPPRRLAELLALSRAGVVRFLGPDTRVRAEGGVFRAAGALSEEVETRCLIEARLRTPSLLDTADDLLEHLVERGECAPQTHRDPDGAEHTTGKISVRAGDHRLLRADGTAHPNRFAIGPYVAGVHTPTSGPGASGFFASNDLLARAVVRAGAVVRSRGPARSPARLPR